VISDDEIYNSQQLGINTGGNQKLERRKLNKSFDSSSLYSSQNDISNAEAKIEMQSEITDMEAGGTKHKQPESQGEPEKRKKQRRKRSKDPNTSNESHNSKSSGEISFVLARKNNNQLYGSSSIFGDFEQSSSDPSPAPAGGFGLFSLGLVMIMCCVSS
jgi:hypothetical protein